MSLQSIPTQDILEIIIVRRQLDDNDEIIYTASRRSFNLTTCEIKKNDDNFKSKNLKTLGRILKGLGFSKLKWRGDNDPTIEELWI